MDALGQMAEMQALASALFNTLSAAAGFSDTAAATASPDDIETFGGGLSAPGFPWTLFWAAALFQFALNWGVRLGIAVPCARLLFGACDVAGGEPPLNAIASSSSSSSSSPVVTRVRAKWDAKVEKFAQSFMEAFFYSGYFAMGAVLLARQPWAWPSTAWWTTAAVVTGTVERMPRDVTCFYVAYCARYLQALVSVFLEPRRKDFYEMVVHHSVTVMLIYLSFVAGENRVGLVIMVLFDIADPFLHIAKQCKYASEARRMVRLHNSNGSAADGGKTTASRCFDLLADLWFAGFAVSFTVTRNVMYPYVVWSAWSESVDAWREHTYHAGLFTPQMGYWKAVAAAMRVGEGACMVLLAVLQVLQIIWQVYLTQAIVKVFKGSELKDERSDSESDADRRAHAD